MNNYFKRRFDLDSDSYESDMQRYYDHVESKRGFIEPNLIKFFKYDFFHDSSVSHESFDYSESSFLMTFNCAGFTNSSEIDSFNVDFYIKFIGVKKIVFDNDSGFDIGNRRTFLHSEIDAILKEDEDGDEYVDQFITMEFVGESEYYISLVFSYLTVEPAEPLAYKMLTEMDIIKPLYPESLSK